MAVALAFAALAGAARRAGAQQGTELPDLSDPARAADFLLAAAPATGGDGGPASSEPRRAGWDGSLGEGLFRALFGGYRTVLSSQDLPVCAFSPSCSRFSQAAIDRCGFVQGALLSLDRLLRDHPMAAGFYPVDAGGRLLDDPPARYCLTAPR